IGRGEDRPHDAALLSIGLGLELEGAVAVVAPCSLALPLGSLRKRPVGAAVFKTAIGDQLDAIEDNREDVGAVAGLNFATGRRDNSPRVTALFQTGGN